MASTTDASTTADQSQQRSHPIKPKQRGRRGPAATDTDLAHRRSRRFNATPLFFLLPALAILLIFSAYPIVRLFISSFQEYGLAQASGMKPPAFIGWANYAKAFFQSDFWLVTLRTVVFMVVTVFLTIALGTLVAILMTKLNKGFRTVLSIGLLLAWAMPQLTYTIVWGWIVDTQYGVLNYVLSQITGHDWTGHQWLLNPLSFYGILVIIVVWAGIPFIVFTVYAAISGIPQELTEAASLDRAGPVRRFFLIELPYVRSVFIVVIILSIIWDMNVFTQVIPLQVLGGTSDQTSTLGVWIYQQGGNGSIGLSAAAGVIMLLMMLVISVFYLRQTLKDSE